MDTKHFFNLVFQFNDCIITESLNKSNLRIQSNSNSMVKIHLVRGYNDKLLYIEKNGSSQKIIMLKLQYNGQIFIKKEVYGLAGTKIIALEAD